MAQQTVKLYARTWGYVDYDTPVGVIDISGLSDVRMNMWTGTAPNWKGSELFFTIDDFPAALSKKRIYYLTAKFAFRSNGLRLSRYLIMHAKDEFDPATLEYSNKPALYGPDDLRTVEIPSSASSWQDFVLNPNPATAALLSSNACSSLRKPTHVLLQYQPPSGSYSSTYGFAKLRTLADDSSLPYIEVTYDDSISIGSSVKIASAPTDGYVNPREAKSFSWVYEKDDDTGYDCVGEEYGQTSATLYWKESTAENYTAIQIADSTQNVTVPANTFPIGKTIEWYLEGTDDGGVTSETEVYSFSTAAGAVTATPDKPVNTVEDGSAPIEFSWTFTSADGQQPSAAELSWKDSTDADWNTVTISPAASTYTMPAGTFSAGSVDWRVRGANIDGTYGVYASANFICVSAPDPAEGISATAVPMSTVSWQSSGQLAYEISIDGEVVKKGFGADVYSWQVEEPLEDGQHTISVRVQGSYGFWSQPSIATITVENDPALTIELTATFGTDADLSWNFSDSGEHSARIYRDGARIANVASLPAALVDRMVLGEHSYFVRVIHSDGNYSQSNTVTGTMNTNTTLIAKLTEGEGPGAWLPLRYSENSAGAQIFDWTRSVSMQHVGGTVWPMLERAPFRDLTGSYDCAFRTEAECAAFEALQGEPVIIKSRRGNVVTGVLSQTNKRELLFYTAYSFALQQIHWEEFIDA